MQRDTKIVLAIVEALVLAPALGLKVQFQGIGLGLKV